MAGTQVTVALDCLDKQRIGYQAMSLTHMNDTLEPQVGAGSLVEVGGALYEFTALESITGWAGIAPSNAVYIKVVPAGASCTVVFTTTAPTWSHAKQGWYNGNDRYIGGLYKDAGGNYVAKSVWQESADALPIGSIIQFDGLGWADNCTLPGWYACIAANAGVGCPNLVDRFIMGKVVAGAGATGGSNTHTNTVTEMASHRHALHDSQSYGVPSYLPQMGGPALGHTGYTDYEGGGAAWDIRPAYYSVIFIRRCA
jgi:hypothetical protein